MKLLDAVMMNFLNIFYSGLCDSLVPVTHINNYFKNSRSRIKISIFKRVSQCCILNCLIFWYSMQGLYNILIYLEYILLFLSAYWKYLFVNFLWLFKSLWILPVFIVSRLINFIWFQDIVDEFYKCKYAKPVLSGNKSSFIPDIFFTLTQQSIFLIQSYLFSYIPIPLFPKFITLMHFSLLYSVYSFEYKWSNFGFEIHKRLKLVETNWPYFLGFGLPLAVVTHLPHSYVISGIVFSLLFPLFILSATEAKPIAQNFDGPSLPIFLPSIYLANLILKITKQVEYIPTKGAWRVLHRQTETNSETAETEMIVGKVNFLLNKISPNNFCQLLDEFKSLTLHINSLDRATGVVKLIFNRALLEPAFVDMYALLLPALCACCEPFKPLCIILTMCQKQFETIKSEKSEEELEFKKKIQEATDENKKRILEEDLNEYILKERDRYLGNIKFVSELLKRQLLTPKIYLDCLMTLYNVKTDFAYECLCNMLRYAGKDFESHPGQRIVEELINNFKKLSKDTNISLRIRFMMTDIIDLKENGWVPRRDEDAPRTYEEIEMEMARENEETRKMAASVLKRQHLQSKGGGNVNRMGETPSPNLYNNNAAGSNSIMSSGLSSNAGMSPMPEFKNLAHRPVGIHSRQEQNLDTIKLGPSKWVRNTSTNANKQISENVKRAPPTSTTTVSVFSNATRNTADNNIGSSHAFKGGNTNISKGAIPTASMVPLLNSERKKIQKSF